MGLVNATEVRKLEYAPAPAIFSPRELQLMQRARVLHTRRGQYPTVNMPSEVLKVLLGAIDRLEADRDAEGNGAVAARQRARILDEQMVGLHKRIGPLVAWAAGALGTERTLDAVLTKIEGHAG